jgi:hypothetical protein
MVKLLKRWLRAAGVGAAIVIAVWIAVGALDGAPEAIWSKLLWKRS